ncbi:MAG: hypothetical protein JXR95_08820 [Deltaproteobacteria bacterium]|nr:hypothetical protein [Deltaproteobacteria bacterium]
MNETKKPENNPTWFEYLLVWLIMGGILFAVYKTVLKPSGYTPGYVYSLVTGKGKKASGSMKSDSKNSQSMKAGPEKKSDTEQSVKKRPSAKPQTGTMKSMELSEDDD